MKAWNWLDFIVILTALSSDLLNQFLRSHGGLSIGLMSALMQKVTCEGLGDLSARRASFRFDRDTHLFLAVEHATICQKYSLNAAQQKGCLQSTLTRTDSHIDTDSRRWSRQVQSSDVISSGVMKDRVYDLLEGAMFVKNVPLFSTLTWGEGGRGFATCFPSLGFFRVFRALRPLRSLNAVPQMKAGGEVGERVTEACWPLQEAVGTLLRDSTKKQDVLVNTVISSVPRLGNVSAVGAFLFLVFGIVGVTLMSGVFNRLCHTAQNPVLVFQNGTGTQCWSWPYAEDDRLCGGAYNCEASGGFCGGLEEDQREELRPNFGANGRMNLPWCVGSEPKKLTPDSEYMNFDNMLWALLVVFQCMTMEGWTDIMYRVQDAYDFVAATLYFFLLIPLTSFFLLNVALAVVDEARADFDEEEASEEEESNEKDGEALRKSLLGEDDEDPDEQPPWLDCSLVHTCRAIAFSEWFMNIIMLFIVSNVITMMMESFPPPGAPQQDIVGSLELTFLVVFCVEMAVLLTALGPHKYFSNPVTAFDGVIVITSVVQMCVGQAGPFTALRTLRLFRVLNKLANRWPSFKVLLKAMVLTAISLNYWLILFALVLYICTLMVQTFFATEFHFNDPDSFDYVTNPGEFWCPGTENEKEAAYRQDCIPRANFDTFLWALVTIFQIMTGENWNTVMYAGMRAAGPGFCLLFVLLILFGQTLFLSLFLSMLMSKFDHVQDSLNQQEDLRREHTAQRLRKKSLESCSIEFPESPKPASSRVLHSAKSMAESLSSFKRSLTERDTWPVGYAWFIFSKTNPVRKLCHWILHAQVEVGGCKILWVKTPKIRLVFDNFILLCILVSTVTMAMDSPLADPKESLTIFLRGADEVFAIIFIGEMVIKLLALGLIWGEDAYLKSAWNWLDGVVVMVSIINMASSSSTGFLKTLRILRAFRPLRVISRNENLKVVVQTIFASMPHLLTLVIVAMLFLLIFALFGLSYLNGTFLMCDLATEPGLAKELGQDFTTPLCFPPAIDQVTVSGGLTHGQFQPSTSSWTGNTTACPGSHYVEYQRITADTPICIGRCLPQGYSTFAQPEWLCPKALTMTEELPAACGPGVSRNISAAEQRGIAYVDQMTRSLILPCGGSTVNSTGHMVLTAQGMSCADLFCGEVDEDVKTQCRATCSQAPYFCVDACGPGLEGSAQCESCKYECEAQCRCPEFCEGLIRDAALCLEQGSRWVPTISQNFNNIWFAMLTLFEISTTEGWVDVMYSAADSVQPYVQPKRDNQEMLWVPFFMLYLFFSNMFIINLSVGVIVDKFMSMKQSNTAVMLTEPQKNWVNSIMSLYSRRQIVNLMDLHEKPWLRRKCYELVSSEFFETSIMGAIVINTLFLAAKITPTPFPEWETFLETVNYIFAGIFTVECVLKIFALRTNYWGDRWNCFDFTCVVATIVGIVVSRASNVRIDPIIQVIRIFRIARLFRLLRFLKGLNKIFMALLMSLPKLMNVLLILLLLLILYSILGVSLFSTTKLGETLNVHANFQNFILAFITLFRASTGEAWNEIMHELAMTEVELYKQGEWCSPVELFDTEAKFEVLKDKCLIEHPNSCAQSPYFSFCFWVTYTLLITFMVMNLVIAVILEGYEDGKESPASEVVDVCVKLWLKHDPDHRLSLPLGEALSFINKALREVDGHHSYASASKSDRPGSSGSGSGLHVLQSLPMKYVAALDVQVGENGRVHFISACKQVMRFVCLGDDLASLEDLDTVEEHMDKKQREKLRRLIEKSELRIHSKIAKDGLAEGLSFATSKGKEGKGLGAGGGKVPMKDLKQEVAALKLQTAFKGILRGKSNGSLDKDKAKAKEAKDGDAAPSTAPAAKEATPSKPEDRPVEGDGGLGQDAHGPFCGEPLEEDNVSVSKYSHWIARIQCLTRFMIILPRVKKILRCQRLDAYEHICVAVFVDMHYEAGPYQKVNFSVLPTSRSWTRVSCGSSDPIERPGVGLALGTFGPSHETLGRTGARECLVDGSAVCCVRYKEIKEEEPSTASGPQLLGFAEPSGGPYFILALLLDVNSLCRMDATCRLRGA
ncbi:unnamed protein product [Symbiodinium sp. CCMP2592]|nr:unnamed protein product [Symbiodinium sp. CCMP2592]